MTKPGMQSGAGAVAEKAATAAVGRGVEATEEQATAIIATAKKAVEEAKTKTTGADGGAGSAAGKPSSSLKRSLECFLQGHRNNKATSSSSATRRHVETSTASSSSSSN